MKSCDGTSEIDKVRQRPVMFFRAWKAPYEGFDIICEKRRRIFSAFPFPFQILRQQFKYYIRGSGFGEQLIALKQFGNLMSMKLISQFGPRKSVPFFRKKRHPSFPATASTAFHYCIAWTPQTPHFWTESSFHTIYEAYTTIFRIWYLFSGR